MILDENGLLLIGRRVTWLATKRVSVDDTHDLFRREVLPWCCASIGVPTRWYPRPMVRTQQNDLTLLQKDRYDCERHEGIWSYILTETFWSLRVWDTAAIVHFKLAWASSFQMLRS